MRRYHWSVAIPLVCAGCSLWGSVDGEYALNAMAGGGQATAEGGGGGGGGGGLGGGGAAGAGGSAATYQLAAGNTFTCSIFAASEAYGQVMCWGVNAEGQLGTGMAGEPNHVPGDVLRASDTSELNSAIEVVAGEHHACALDAGDVRCWGDNYQGVLGSQAGPGVELAKAIRVTEAGNQATALASGRDHNCMISAGKVMCWGSNLIGQLSDESEFFSADPVEVPTDLTGAPTLVAAGYDVSCASDGVQVQCWGDNSAGQAGQKPVGGDSPVPAVVEGLPSEGPVLDLDCGAYHCCAVVSTENGNRVSCWGQPDLGQLGNPAAGGFEPRFVTDIDDAVAVTAGYDFSCALHASGGASCWGNDFYGTLGDDADHDGDKSELPVVPDLPPGLTFRAIDAGFDHVCAMTDLGATYCWGNNAQLQLGRNDVGDSKVPLQVGM